MSKQEFEKFLEKKAVIEPSKIDWQAEKKEWLKYLDQLYSLFEKALKNYVEEGKVEIKYDNIEITEENIGTYKVKRLIILLGGERIVLNPIGTLLIGAKGRVDMSSKSSSVKIVLVNSRMKSLRDQIEISVYHEGQSPKSTLKHNEEAITWEWKFLPALPPHNYQPVNEDTIYSVIMELLND